MRKISVLFLLVCLCAVLAQTASAQTRPRRVGSNTSTQPPAARTPVPETSRRPPVLGGANTGNRTSVPSTPQQPTGPEEVDAGDVIKVSTTLVSIPVSVMDRDGKYIPNLRKEDFRLWEEGVEQQVAYFASVEKPFTVALVIDTSGSTRERLNDIQEAAIAFVGQLRPTDRVMVVTFDERINVLAEPTSDRYRLRDAILRTS